MGRQLPSGIVTFLFTDVEGSTRLLQELGADPYAAALAEHGRIVREAVSAHGGVEVNTWGDAFFVAFADPIEALAAASKIQHAFGAGPIRVRIGMHTGEPIVAGEDYVGVEVHRAARIASAAHGGQVVLSRETRLRLGDGVRLTDLGEHRVKDFDQPVWLFQLGQQSFPPLRTVSNTNLPKPASSFVGRQREVDEITSLVRKGARLITLSGPGGSGKTRLAIEAASELVPDHRNGVFWVGLAPLRDPTLVLQTVGQTLGARDGVADHIGEREMLLLLDNFEQLVQAAPDLASLVEACPNLHLLVTSRERLRVRGEVDYSVPPLSDAEAVDLFCARAQVEADQTIAELCRRLEDLPLAVELSAARTSVLSPRQVLERLGERLDLLKGGRDAQARQQTLRATIEWSHDLLSTQEQRLFARLSVFAGVCTLDAASAVAEADLDTIQSLVDKSLVRHHEERFRMLETIREFAVERLRTSGEAGEMERRHADYFLAMAEEAEPKLRAGSGEEPVLDQLQREHDNLRAALDRLEAAGETQRALRLAGAVSRFWYLRGYFLEGQRRLENLLGKDQRPTAARAKALNGAAVMAYNTGRLDQALVWVEEAIELNRELGDAWASAYSEFMLANIVGDQGDRSRAVQLLEATERAFDELGDNFYTLQTRSNRAYSLTEMGEVERARELTQENLARARKLHMERVEAQELSQLAVYFLDTGQVGDAPALLRQSISIDHRLGDVLNVALNLRRLAYALALDGKATTAAQLLANGMALLEEIGSTFTWIAEMNEKALTAIRAQIDDAAFSEAWRQGQSMTVDEAVALAIKPDLT
jgi:predicted ATPase/class 3 adenylate cyclase